MRVIDELRVWGRITMCKILNLIFLKLIEVILICSQAQDGSQPTNPQQKMLI